MPRQPKSKDKSLGKSLIKNHEKGRTVRPDKSTSVAHTNDLDDGFEWAKFSITDQTSLDEFLTNAQLAGREFTAERRNIKIIDPTKPAGIPSLVERSQIAEKHKELSEILRVPRRPRWDLMTTPEELNKAEMESFLEWRRNLATFQEQQQAKQQTSKAGNREILMTPFEKNLDFWRQLWRVLERSDLLVQILDARNPLQFYCEDLFKYSNELSTDKVNMVLLNKADLLTPDQRAAWCKYFKDKNITAVCYSAKDQTIPTGQNTEEEVNDEDKDQSKQQESDEKPVQEEADDDEQWEDCDSESDDEPDLQPVIEIESNGRLYTSSELINIWKQLHDASKTKVKEGITTVGLVGYPNVGKSSTINALLEAKRVSVSATPGKTKHFQTIFLAEDLLLCDCPGLVFPAFATSKADMILNGILPIDTMTDHVPPVSLVAQLIPRHVLQATYGIVLPDPKNKDLSSESLLNAYGQARGFMTAHGLPDNPRSSRVILKDFVNGKLLYCWAPPGVDQAEYHKFPEMEAAQQRGRTVADMTPVERRLHAGHLSEEKFNQEFFTRGATKAHVKGGSITPGIRALGEPGEEVLNMGKPWKKHNNRNKKEKLRRVYAHLDLH